MTLLLANRQPSTSLQARQVVKFPPPRLLDRFDTWPNRMRLSSSKREYPCVAPSQPESRLMSKQLAKPKHHAINERKKQVDGSTAEDRPEGGGLVEDDGGGRRRGW